MKKIKFSTVIFVLLLMVVFATNAFCERKVVLWWTVEFSPAEKTALEAIVSDFQKETGIKVEWSSYSSSDLWAKVMTGIEAGNPPDVSQVLSHSMVLLAYRGLLADVSDLIEAHKNEMIPASVDAVYLYNQKIGKRGYYCIPWGLYTLTINYWASDLKKAGYEKLPSNWNDFWKALEKAQEVTGKYAVGWTHSDRAEFDLSWPIEQLIVCFGGELLKDGKLNVDDPKNRKAVIDALKFHTRWYLEGKAPPGVTEWGDADNNKGFQTHLMTLTLNPTLSIPRWFYDNARDKYFNETASSVYPQPGPRGKDYAVTTNVYPMIIPANAPNPKEAKEFVRFFMRKENYDKYIQGVEGRFFPMYKSTFDNDYFANPKDPHIYPTRKHFLGQGVPVNWMLHPAYAKFVIGHNWHKMVARIIVDRWSAEKAVDEALTTLKRTFKRF
ncbi:MAG: carbohydrate ABC transporter substrate-binding protein [Deltaproteobacteria bacterium]|nr:carbohydrate ABC transporter substrate-binding protein [Deltaproteobacteria bacterium]